MTTDSNIDRFIILKRRHFANNRERADFIQKHLTDVDSCLVIYNDEDGFGHLDYKHPSVEILSELTQQRLDEFVEKQRAKTELYKKCHDRDTLEMLFNSISDQKITYTTVESYRSAINTIMAKHNIDSFNLSYENKLLLQNFNTNPRSMLYIVDPPIKLYNQWYKNGCNTMTSLVYTARHLFTTLVMHDNGQLPPMYRKNAIQLQN